MKSVILDATRGFLIGIAEVIPGVSGGTVALVVGLYDRIIASATSFIRGILSLVTKSGRLTSRNHFSMVDYRMLLPLVLGMGIALVAGAKVLEPLIADYPQLMRALFAGMIATSIYVPLRMAGRLSLRSFGLLALGAIGAFVLTSLPRAAAEQPAGWWIVLSAALAVCALVLPGVSGSFLLLSMGMYQPTIAAVNDRDFGYLGLFLVGAIIGLGSFAFLMQYLLARYHRATLALMAGLMIGSLRALWPWQSETGNVEPISNIPMTALLFLLGASIVAGLIVWERQLEHRPH